MLRRRKSLSEVDCYCRCYGPSRATVRALRAEPLPRGRGRLSGEGLRRMFEQRLDARPPDAVYESEAA